MTLSLEPSTAESFEKLLDYIKNTRGVDFAAYKPASLMRRIQRRMQVVKIDSYDDYSIYLEAYPEEFAQLFNTILINVTDFFRDAPAWDLITHDIIPRIVELKKADEPIRIWSAGCASGQETYTLAMILCEHIGLDAFRQRVKIYGTDADNEALSEARQASYTPQQTANVPPELCEKYFETISGRSVFRKDLRRSVIFGRHDLLQDAPISRIDLLVCRNTLMYFNAQAQARILSRFDFAINGTGFLFLGKAEVLLTRNTSFVPVDLKRRIFAKLPKYRTSTLMTLLPDNTPDPGADTPEHSSVRLRDMTLEFDPNAQIVVYANGRMVLANAQARLMFGLTTNDIGQRLQDLPLAYKPVELRFMIEQAYAERRPLTLKEVEWVTPAGDKRFLDITVHPLTDAGQRLGLKIIFADVTRFKRLQDELHQTRQELETTNEELQSSNEELETTNEELQSTVEELETTNEELQSTNEEMETMNEELQSTNEELQAINEQVEKRSDDVNRLNAFLESIMTSLRDGVAVVDQNLALLAWNHKAEDLWGVKAEEVKGRNFLGLDIGLPVEQFKRPILDCLSEKTVHEDITVDAINRRGKPVQIRVSCSRLMGPDKTTHGVILIMEELKIKIESDTL